MKTKKITILAVILMVLSAFVIYSFNEKSYAAGNISVSPSSLDVEIGTTKSFTITAMNTIGDVTITSDNPSIATVGQNEWSTGMVDEQQTKTGTINVTGINQGSTTITMVVDAATFDGDDLNGQVRKITINVIPKQNNNNNNANNNSNNNNGNTPKKQEVNNNSNQTTNNTTKSNNTKLKEITVDNYKLNKIDDNNYSLVVNNNIEKINVNAKPEESKSKISGVGEHKINVGQNKIELIITSESGQTNTINILVERKDAFYLEDLTTLLNDDSIKDKNIKIKENDIIKDNDIKQIKKSKKQVYLNYYDDNKQLLYSWIIDGAKINKAESFNTNILFKSKNESEIKNKSNYAEGIIIHLNESSSIPTGTKVKLYVGNKYTNNDFLNIYNYNNKKKQLENVISKVSVKKGYIEFNVTTEDDYLISMATIKGLNQAKTKNTSGILPIIFLIVSITVFILSVVIVYIRIKKININDNKLVDQEI